LLERELYRPGYRLTVDEPEDLVLMKRIFEELYRPGQVLETIEAIRLLDAQPELARINAHLQHKPANYRSVELDKVR
jgi:spore coat polysaccharide biosynthesis protein SpsF (cytidylyltransferase family)